MNPPLVFTKTDAGREALVSRPAGLGPRLRSLLIMVDGRRDMAAFDQLLGGPGSAQALLASLQEQGWIEPVRGTGTLGAAPMPAGAPAEREEVAGGTILPFAEARRLVARFVNDQLGPMGETLALRVEGCRSPAELHAALPRIRDGLLNLRNHATVARFDQELAGRLPAS